MEKTQPKENPLEKFVLEPIKLTGTVIGIGIYATARIIYEQARHGGMHLLNIAHEPVENEDSSFRTYRPK